MGNGKYARDISAGKDGPGESHYFISTKVLPKEADYY